MSNRLPWVPRVGQTVAYKPGTGPYRLGVRTGTIILVDLTVRQWLKRGGYVEGVKPCPLSDETLERMTEHFLATWPAEVLDRTWPIVELHRCLSLPVGAFLAVDPELLEPVAADDLEALN
jgi:hypothetical protein